MSIPTEEEKIFDQAVIDQADKLLNRKTNPVFKPKEMEIVDGNLIMADHSDVDCYLSEWQERHEHPDFTRIRILTHKQYEELRSAAGMAGIA